VGASGAGKTTVVKLLLRFYDPGCGSVRLDDQDIREVALSCLRDNVTVVLQENLIFDGTIRDNIAYGRPGARDAEITTAARADDDHHLAQPAHRSGGRFRRRSRRRPDRRARDPRRPTGPRRHVRAAVEDARNRGPSRGYLSSLPRPTRGSRPATGRTTGCAAD